MNGRSWSRLRLLPALLTPLVTLPFALALAAAPVDIDSFDLPPGKSVTFEFQVTVDSPMPPGDNQVCNQGSFTATLPTGSVLTDDPDTGAASDPTCTTILLLADLSVTKSDGAATEVPGTPVTYFIVASNAGPATVIDGVVADTFPASLTGCSTTAVGAGGASGFDAGPFAGNINDTGITLPAGASVTYTSTCNIAPGATGTLANTVTISSAGTTDPVPGDNSATDSDTLVPSTDVAITKTDGVTTEIPGTPVTYTIVASNSGPSTATSVTVADTFPASLTGCSTTSVAAGGATGNDAGPVAGNLNDTGITLPPSSSVTFTATCNISAAATGSLANTATITSGTADPNSGNNSSTDTDSLTPTADVAVTKTDGSATEVPGTPVTYTIVALNAVGPSVATGVTVTDTFPAILSGCQVTSVAAGGATGNDAGPVAGNLNASGITLPVGSSVTFTATCNIDPAATGNLVNTASASTAVIDPTPSNSATDIDTLNASADLAITKTDGSATEVPGTPVTYTIVASNSGPSTAVNVTVADTFPASLSGCSTTSVAAGGATGNDAGPVAGNLSDSGITLPSGASVTFTATCNIDSAASGSLSNTATVSSSTTDPSPGNNSATDSDTLNASADVAITKTDGATAVSPGVPIVYTIVASNNGPSAATGVTVSDTFPAALTGCSTTSVASGGATGNDAGPVAGSFNDTGISLPVGSTVTYTVSCTVDAGATGSLANTATVTSGTADPNSGNNSATDTDTVQPLDYGDAPTAAQSGFAGSYPVTQAQDGARHVNLGPTLGAARDFEPNGQPTATADGDDANGSPDDEDGVTFGTLVACQGGTATVNASASGGRLNVWIDWNRDGDWADPGEQVATDQVVTAGDNTVNFTVPCSAAVGATFSRFRLATATGLSFTGQAADGEVEDHAVTVTASGDLSVTKTDGLTSAVPGQTGLVYTIVASNAGPSPLAGVSLSDTFPVVLTCGWTSVAAGGATGNTNNPGPANLAETLSLPVGGSVTYTVNCTINPSATGTLSNTATIATTLPNTSDPSAGNNSATDNNTLLTPIADMAITKTDGSATEVPGTPVTYTLVASNAGPSTATGVTVADTFPAILSGCSTTSVAAGGATGNDAGPVAGNLADSGITLPPGSSVTFTATCNIDVAATGSLANTATITGATSDPSAGNNSATDTDTLTPQADVSVTKTDGSATEVPGTPVTYTLVLANAGPSTATGVTLADTFPATLTGCSTTSVAAGGATGNDVGPVAGNLNDGGITLPSGASVTYTATCNVDPAATGSLANTVTASVGGGITDPVPGNNSATDTDTLNPSADVAITKTDGSATEVPGTPVTYTIVASNAGPSTATSVTVADTFTGILSGCTTTSVAAGGATGNDAGPVAGNLNDTGITLPPSASVTFTATCNIDPAATGSLANTGTIATATTDPAAGNNSATDTDTLAPSADVAITKTNGGTLSSPGAPVVYTIVASNAGPSTAVSVTVADTFPASLTGCSTTSVAAGGATGNDAGPTAGNINDGGITLPPGASVTYTASCTLDIGATGTLANTATVTSGTTDPNSGNNSATDTDTIQPLDYGDAPTAAQSGLAGTYPVTLAQDGARHATLGLTLGASRDSEVNGQPTAASDGDDATGTDDEDGVTFGALVACQSATATVTASTGGGRLNAWIDWNRDGDWADAGEQVATDLALNAGPNAVSFTVPCTVSLGTSFSRFRLATASGLSFTGQAADGEVEDHAVTLTASGDLAVTKTDGLTSAVPGQTALTYTIVASNAGPSPLAGVSLTDTFPAVLTCGWTSVAAGGAAGNTNNPGPANLAQTLSLPAGGSVTYTVSCTINPSATGTLSNTATIATTLPNTSDPSTGNNSATDNNTVLTPIANLSITKTDGAATEVPGTPVSYTIVVANAGPSAEPNATVADTFPAALTGCSTTSVAAGGATGNDAGPVLGNLNDGGVNLPPGASVTYTANCTVAATATGNLVNTATVTATVTDPAPGDNSATDTDTLDPQVDVAITKTDGSAGEVPGTPVTYTIVASNATGPSVATGVTVADTFPASLTGCQVTSVAAGGATGNDAGPVAGNLNDTGITLPMGASVTYTATCNVDPAATGNLANTATVAVGPGITDTNPANNSATDTDTLAASADVSITKTDGAASEVPGTPVTYTIVVSNAGPSTAASVAVTDPFAGILSGCSTTSVAAGGATGNDAGPLGGDINDTGISLPPGASVTYTATCNISSAATGTLDNTAKVASPTPDPNPANNSATDSDPLNKQTDLAITKVSDTNPVAANQVFNFLITVQNIGPSDSVGFTVTDTLPAATSAAFVSATGTGWACGAPVGVTLTCTHGALASGATTATLSVQMQVAAVPSPPNFSNTATVSTVESDPVVPNNTATAPVSTDTTRPFVTAVATAEDSGDGALTPCETVRVRVEEISFRFSENLYTGPADGEGTGADDPASYLLVRAGGNGSIDTQSCEDGVEGDDVAMAIDAVTYQADTPSAGASTVTLAVSGESRLHSSLYRLFACASLHDAANNNLAGDGTDPNTDADLARTFRIDAFNLLANGHFDCDAAGWQLQDTAWQAPPADYQGSQQSGSLRSSQDDAAAGQCVALGALPLARERAPYDLEGRLRLDPQANLLVNWSLTCTFFSGAGCTGSASTATGRFGTTSSATGVWLQPRFRFETLPAGAVSARCGFDFGSVTGFAGDLDAVVLRGNGSVFEDGFESGDTSKWQ